MDQLQPLDDRSIDLLAANVIYKDAAIIPECNASVRPFICPSHDGLSLAVVALLCHSRWTSHKLLSVSSEASANCE